MGEKAGTLDFLSQTILNELKRLDISSLTEIQDLAIPKILSGENAVLIAPTGEGKTEAAIFPVFDNFLKARAAGEKLAGISILYVTPLRALNRDILRRLVEIGTRLDIKVEVRHGDTPKASRELQSKRPPNMLITTPETLQAILAGRRMIEHLKNIRWLIVDEIHEFADDKRGAQLSLALERLSSLAFKDFQRIGLSATVGDPSTIAAFLAGKGRRVSIVKAEFYKQMVITVENPIPRDIDEKLSEKFLIPQGSISRINHIMDAIKNYRSSLIFTNTREHAESLASKIRMVNPQLRIGVHHGSIAKEARIEAEQQIKSGDLKVLVCTSSLELGLDIGTTDFVVQYQSPKQAVKAVQRIGRSSHTVNGRPRGIIVATWPDDILESSVIVRRALAGEFEKPTVQFCALDVLAHQITGLALNYGSISVEKAFHIVKRSYPYFELLIDDFIETVELLASQGIIRFNNEKIIVKPPQSYQYYFENLSMISEVKHYQVVDFTTRRRIGLLDQEFVARNGKPGKQFILHGLAWQILSVEEEKEIVEVESVDPTPAAIPSWEGEVIPVSYDVAMEVGKIRREIEERLVNNQNPLDALKVLHMNEYSRFKVVESIRKHVEKDFPLPHDRKIVIESFENYIIIHGCFGDKVNQTLSRILASMLTAKSGFDVAVQADPYRIALISPYPLDPHTIEKEILTLKTNDARKIVDAMLDRTNLFLWVFWNNAKRFGVVRKNTEYRLSQAQALLRVLRSTPIYKETFREICLENLDVNTVEEIIGKISAGNIAVEVCPLEFESSPLALPLLDKIAPHDLLRPIKEAPEIVPIIRNRLRNRNVRLVCVFKGDWSSVRKIDYLPEKIQCPKCKSTLIASLYEKDEESEKIVKKKIGRKKLTGEEEKLWLTLWKNASLIQTYDKKAVIVMAARGVGPTKAVKILGKKHKSEEKFYMEILKAEREYLRTKMFWD